MHATIVAALTLSLGVLLTGCGADEADEPARTISSSTTSLSPSDQPADLSIEAFAGISDLPVSGELAAALDAALREMSDMAGGTGMSATVMSAIGTWSGTVGTADGDRDLRVDDQFAIASGTKPVVAAQVMQLVEAGLLDLDDPVANHLPPDLAFDTNAATIRHLLSHRSGLPDFEPKFLEEAATDPDRRWTARELVTLVPAGRSAVDRVGEYSSTNYLLLQLVIEQVSGRQLVPVLRDGVLDVDGLDRLVYQPDEVPTDPMAMPFGGSMPPLGASDDYLPTLANASGGGGAWGIASDSPSLAKWWRALCAGDIVSQHSLTEMATLQDDYGLGMISFGEVGTLAFGHPGVENIPLPGDEVRAGYVSWSACLPEMGTVVVVLANGDVNDLFGLGRPLIAAAQSYTTE